MQMQRLHQGRRMALDRHHQSRERRMNTPAKLSAAAIVPTSIGIA